MSDNSLSDHSLSSAKGAVDQFEKLGRYGWAARGLTYLLVGMIIIQIARGTGTGEDADQKGALRLLAEAPAGGPLLIGLTIGLVIFAVWELAQLLGMDGTDVMSWFDRIGKIIGIGFYGSLAYSAVELLGRSSGSSSWTVERVTQWALGQPLGRVAIALAGVIVIAIAVRRGRRVFTGEFSDDLVLDDASSTETTVIRSLGRAGEAGRSASFVLIGFFLISAGWRERASEAGGLDDTLRQVTSSTWGTAAALFVAIGFVLYGLFCLTSAPHRVLLAKPDDD